MGLETFSIQQCVVTLVVLLSLLASPIDSIASQDVASSVPLADEPLAEPRILVLLVGVTNYPTLKPRQQLKGPGNDVVLVESLLEAAFQKQIAHKVILREQTDEKFLPTRANIERELDALATMAKSGDQVLILFAGHGSQQPDLDGDEQDGFDEIVLPRDIGVWDSVGKTVENAISDDQMREWLTRIRMNGAFVFFVADTCHSGSMARGDEAVRRAVESADLRVPGDVSQSRAPSLDNKKAQTNSDEELPGGLVSLYAARPTESTYEDEIPKRGLRHGRLTWALCESLSSVEGTFTYADVARRISWQYEQHRWYESHPLIEGTDLNREFLGTVSFNSKSPPYLKVSRTKGLTVTAGSLHGIQPGTILAVYGPGKSVVGHVKVTNSQAVGAEVEPVAYNDLPANDSLPPNSECEIVYLDFGDQDLKLAVDVSHVSHEIQESTRDKIESELSSIAQDNKLAVTIVESVKDAEWLVLVSKDQSVLHLADIQDVQKDAAGKAFQRPGSQWMTIAGTDANRSTDLSANLRKVISASNLRKLARQDAEASAVAPVRRKLKNEVLVKQTVEKLVDSRRAEYAAVAQTGTEVKDKDTLRVTIINTSAFPIDITLLYVGNDCSITSFFPKVSDSGGRNRLEPMQSHVVDKITINDNTIGLEDLILIAVESEKSGVSSVSFSFLDQAGVRSGTRGSVQGSPLQKLLDSRDRGDGQTRGGGAELGKYAIQRFSWTVTK